MSAPEADFAAWLEAFATPGEDTGPPYFNRRVRLAALPRPVSLSPRQASTLAVRLCDLSRPGSDEPARLRLENERLRAEVARLRDDPPPAATDSPHP